MREDLFSDTPAFLQSFFISLHIFDLSSGLPFLLTKTAPLFIFCYLTYFLRILQSSVGKNAHLRFPLQLISALPLLIASTVMKRNSDTRMPVEHIVCISKYSLWLLFALAAKSSFSYSLLVSSFSFEAKICFCTFMVFTRSSYHS